METSSTAKKLTIYDLIPIIMSDCGPIAKTQTNQQQGFKFRGIDDAYNHLQPLLAKYGVFTVPRVIDRSEAVRTTKAGGQLIHRRLTVEFKFFATDGSFVECVIDGEAMDSGDKASSKALAIAHKYALLQVFCIPTAEEKDPDFKSHEVVGSQTNKTMAGTPAIFGQLSSDLPKDYDNSDLDMIPFGKYKGQTFAQVGRAEMQGYLRFLIKKAHDSKTSLSPYMEAFIDKAKAYWTAKDIEINEANAKAQEQPQTNGGASKAQVEELKHIVGVALGTNFSGLDEIPF